MLFGAWSLERAGTNYQVHTSSIAGDLRERSLFQPEFLETGRRLEADLPSS
jgi:hypothetical protein